MRIPTQTFQLASITSFHSSAINNLLLLFRDEQQGLLFIQDALLPEYTFIAIEAIWWAIEHGEDIPDEATALSLFQVRENERERLVCWHTAFSSSFYLPMDIFGIVQIRKIVFVLDSFSISS